MFKSVLLIFIITSLYSETNIISPIDWKHAGGNENNFDIWAVGVDRDQLYRIDLKSGNITVVGGIGINIHTAGFSFSQKGELYMLYSNSKSISLASVNTDTGQAITIVEYGRQEDPTIGFEISTNGKHKYWINKTTLHELHDDGTIEAIMPVDDGSWCLANAPGNCLYAVGVKSHTDENGEYRNLMKIDPNKKSIEVIQRIESDWVPAIALTPGGRIYCSDWNNDVYGIPNNEFERLGTIGEVCHGFAIAPGPKIDK